MRNIVSILLVYLLIAAIITIIEYYMQRFSRSFQTTTESRFSTWLVFLIVSIGCFLGGSGYYLLNNLITRISTFIGIKIFPPIFGGVGLLAIFVKLQQKKDNDR